MNRLQPRFDHNDLRDPKANIAPRLGFHGNGTSVHTACALYRKLREKKNVSELYTVPLLKNCFEI